MIWALVVMSLTGIVLGAMFSAPALVAASGLIVLASCVTAPFVGMSVSSIVVFVLCALATLQASYLVGLFLASWVRSTRTWYSRLLRGPGQC